ncbi:MAG: DUF58 domain-containing protein [Pseudoclavibacter sp.]|nr:DUF58 domain-containing protein [Pseudoclavibacter sp.]
MSTKLLTRIRSRMFLRARRRVLHLLDGQYTARLRGRSMDFDDLREYVPGDEVRDIDWKASARSAAPLVKRYVAERRHRVLFVVDRGRNLRARSAAGEEKLGIALAVVGVLGTLALRHGDETGMVTGDEQAVAAFPFRGSERALERMLRAVHDGAALNGPRSDLPRLLERVALTERRRVFLVIVADELDWDERTAALLRRLAAQHETIWVQLGDADPAVEDADGRRAYDVAGGWAMPAQLAANPSIRREYEYRTRLRRFEMEETFDRHAVSFARVEREEEVVPALLRMLKARSHVRH